MKKPLYTVTVKQRGQKEPIFRKACDSLLILTANDSNDLVNRLDIGEMDRYQAIMVSIVGICHDLTEEEIPELRRMVSDAFDEAEHAVKIQKLKEAEV